MTPLQFEGQYEADWTELETLLARLAGRKHTTSLSLRGVAPDDPDAPISGARVTSLYRRACEHLALARGRSYPGYLVDRLERLTTEAHQRIYQRREFGPARFSHLVAVGFPVAVRQHRVYVLVAALAFLLPTFIVGGLVYAKPEMILSVVSADTASSMEEMYSPSAPAIGRERTASTDWAMFGHYIRNNISVAFQCFAGGLFGGLGSLFFLAFNGAFGGGLAGFLTSRGLAPTFYSFVVTHAAFELTAIVLAGAAGFRIGHAWLAPRRRTRLQSLVEATRETAVLLYGVIALLVIAAFIEAFWSSAQWIPHAVKYSVASVCWMAVFVYLIRQGRHAG